MDYDVLYRPVFHFTPAEHWINDPNGLVYYAGEYHLFYQYHPHSSVWGPMHWGHAVSTDLMHWTELPIALAPDKLGDIFSGSAVIDRNNTAGFGANAMIAFFTHHIGDGPHQEQTQSQSIAYSLDKGRTWTKYAGNPVIPPPEGVRDFRDPKVIWYGSEEAGRWVMSLATPSAILFYTSPNLMDWTPSGRFGDGWGHTAGLWETPDLFELPVAGTDETRWVLLVGAGEGAAAPAGGTGEQYFIGHFDGQTFTSENPADSVLWADYGPDAYAGQTWTDAPDGRRIKISWMNNWLYARETPTRAWRGAMTVPRELSLRKTPTGIRLIQQPVAELDALRRNSQGWRAVNVTPDQPFAVDLADGAQWEITVEFDLRGNQAGECGLRLTWSDGSTVSMGYAIGEQRLWLDRSRSGATDFHPAFSATHDAPLVLTGDTLRLRLLLDHSALELFADDGLITMTEQIFSTGELMALELFAVAASVTLTQLTATKLHG